MPILFSSPNGSNMSEKVLWVDDYVSKADAGLLTPTTESFGFRTYIPSTAKALLSLDPVEYLAVFRDQLAETDCDEPAPTPAPPKLQGLAKEEAEILVRKALGMADPNPVKISPTPATKIDDDPIPDPAKPKFRKSAPLLKLAMAKLRPVPVTVPFQYIWAVHHEKGSSSPSAANTTSPATYTDRLTTLSTSVPNIGEFYKVFNNVPWSTVKCRDSMHIFRAGVKPLWEDPENIDGGAWTLKVRKQPKSPHQQQLVAEADSADRVKRVWEEICLMACGGELQAAMVDGGCHDEVLGMSFSPRLYWVCISVWLKKGGMGEGAHAGGRVVQETILERLSPELKPTSEAEYYYKKHSDHDGWEEAVGRKKLD